MSGDLGALRTPLTQVDKERVASCLANPTAPPLPAAATFAVSVALLSSSTWALSTMTPPPEPARAVLFVRDVPSVSRSAPRGEPKFTPPPPSAPPASLCETSHPDRDTSGELYVAKRAPPADSALLYVKFDLHERCNTRRDLCVAGGAREQARAVASIWGIRRGGEGGGAPGRCEEALVAPRKLTFRVEVGVRQA